MMLDLLYIGLGLVFLVLSADKFIDGAANVARYLGMSSLLVGMLIVGFGTSAPEMIVSAIAAHDGSPGIALGNAYGSNIANIALILGLALLIHPLRVNKMVTLKEMPILLVALLLSYALFWDAKLERIEALSLIVLLVLYIWRSIISHVRNKQYESLTTDEDVPQLSKPKAITYLLLGLIVLLISSKFLVLGAANIARTFGVSDLIIGLTVVALGTSLPELAATIFAIKKGEDDIALGNIVGSALFNVLAVVGIAGMFKPLSISGVFMQRDFTVVAMLCLLLWGSCLVAIKRDKPLFFLHGVLFFSIFVAYSFYLFLSLK